MSVPEGWAQGDPSNLPEPVENDVFTMLSNRRRRIIVVVLSKVEGPVEMGQMAEYITAIEEGVALSSITSEDRKARYVGIYQVHAEKLADSCLIATDDRGYGLVPTERTYRVADRLCGQMAAEEPSVLDGIDRVLSESYHGRDSAPVPADISLFRVPTPSQFRDLREAVGLTQTDIAESIGVSNATVSLFEKGETSMRSEALRGAVEFLRRQDSE